MAWLVRDGEVLASLEVAGSRAGRARGLLGRDGIDGVLHLPDTRSVHTFGMRFDIDVAFLDADLRVVKMRDAASQSGHPAGLVRPVPCSRRRPGRSASGN